MTFGIPIHPCVLVVDHVPRTRRRIATSIYRRGYDTLEASDGQEALAVLAAHRSEICAIVVEGAVNLTDDHFGDHQAPPGPLAHVPVIAFTTDDRPARGPSGADDALLRPSTREELDTAVVGYCLAKPDVGGPTTSRRSGNSAPRSMADTA